MKRLLFSAFIMLFTGGLFAQVNFVSTDNVSPQTHADKVVKEIQAELNLDNSQAANIKSITMDATSYIQRIADLKSTNPTQFKAKLESIVEEVDLKIYNILEERQRVTFKELIARPINTQAGK